MMPAPRTGPLAHIRVLDLSRIMAGPWAGQILADLGADVVKVERPGLGDDTRSWGPPFLRDAAGQETTDAAYFLCVNRGKRSITLDLRSDDGQRIVRKLAARSDVVLENYKFGDLARYGLAYEHLAAENPRLVFASVTGFGQTGPRREQAAYDFMIQAMGGLMSVTGERDDAPGGGPQKVGVPIVDLMTGMYASIAILAALVNRDRTGQGECIDLAMLDVQAAFLANQAMNYLISGREPRRGGNRHPNIQPQDVYACRTGRIALAVGNDGQFAKFCAVIDRPELALDARFRRGADRIVNLPSLTEQIATALATRDAAEWSPLLEAAGVPASVINSIPAALSEPQVVARGMLRDVPHATAGTIKQVVSPMRFAHAPLSFEHGPPTLGQHTDEILGELGLDAVEIARLRAQAVL